MFFPCRYLSISRILLDIEEHVDKIVHKLRAKCALAWPMHAPSLIRINRQLFIRKSAMGAP